MHIGYSDIVVKNKNDLQPVYKICGDPIITEEILELEGYMNNGSVRIGNESIFKTNLMFTDKMILSLEPLFTDNRINKITPPPPIEIIDKSS